MPRWLILAMVALVLCGCSNQTITTENEIIPSQTVESLPDTLPTATKNVILETADPTSVINSPVGCQSYSIISDPTVDEISRFPESLPGDWHRGPENAPIRIIEYGDFQCPNCAALEPMLKRLMEEFPDQIRIIYRHFPLVGFPDNPIHDKAVQSAVAAEAAGKQGEEQFWALHDLLFAEQQVWSAMTAEDFERWLITQAGMLNLNVDQFQADLSDQELWELANNAWLQGVAINLTGTPSLVINGRLMESIPMTYSNLATTVKLILMEDRQYATCPLITIDQNRQYLATLHTNKGEIVLELFANLAPLAVNNFVFLAREGFYDNVTFHKVLPGFIAQSGDPSGTGFGGPGYTFIDEIVEGLNFDIPGVLAMANAGPDTNGSQFFITLGSAPQLNGEYTIFGRVLSGMEILSQLTPRNPNTGMNLPPGDLIQSVTIEEK